MKFGVLLITLQIVSAIQAESKPVCNKVHCPFAPTPLGCARGSVLKPNPSNPCCPCCVNTETNECQDPPDCSKEVDCPYIPEIPRCPENSSVETKGCCRCCVSAETGDCVDYLPPVCSKRPCLDPLPTDSRCPDGSSLNTTIDPSGCETCPCCVNATGDCVPAVPVLIGPCPRYACIKPPDQTERCPHGSRWTNRPPRNGCPQCPCCLTRKRQCVPYVSKGSQIASTATSSPAPCLPKPCPYPLPPGTTCPEGSSLNSTLDETGCPNCPCCLNSTDHCVVPVKAVCPKYACIAPPSKCPKKTTWKAPPDVNGCPQCPCCLNSKTNQCVDPEPIACPMRLCVQPVPDGSRCPDGSSYNTSYDQNGCPDCLCCVSAKTEKCVDPVPCPIYDCAPPMGNECPPGATWTTQKDENNCPTCACCMDSSGNCVPPISTESAALQPN